MKTDATLSRRLTLRQVSCLGAALLVGLLALAVYFTHAVIAQALLFPGMLVFGTLMDSTSSYTFYVLSAIADVLLYAGVIYLILRFFRR